MELGVPPGALDSIDLLVPSAKTRRDLAGVTSHVHTGIVETGSLLAIGPGIHVADIRLTALQAAQDLSFVELVEYYSEICGSYELPLDPDDSYRERPPLTSIVELQAYFDSMSSCCRGSRKARRALQYTRENMRSPLETALVMMLVLPRSEGGLGLRTLRTDHRIDVPPRAQHLTRRHHFYCDAYLPNPSIDFEYHGFKHDDECQTTIDDERVNAMRVMGIKVLAVKRWAFFDSASFRRFSAAVRREAHLAATRFPPHFDQLQERLRQFVLRRYQ